MKPSFFLAGISIFLFFFFHLSPAQSQENIDTLDAFTSASKALEVAGGTIYPTYAIVQWKEYYEDEPHVEVYQLQWGTEPETFTNVIDLKPYERKTFTTTTISPLNDNTQYYARFYRVYEEKAKTTDFDFKTPEFPDAVSQPVLTIYNKNDILKQPSVLYMLNGRVLRHNQPDTYPFTLINKTASGIYLMHHFTKGQSGNAVRTVINR